MENNSVIFIIILFYLNIFLVNTYVIFDLNTFKNNSYKEEEYANYFYNNYNNIIYSEITLGLNKQKYIMEIQTDSIGFTIFNHNCEIPPSDNSKATSYLPTLANSTLIEHIDDNETEFFGEYYTSILENIIYVNTDKGEKNTKIDFLFSPRDDPNYTKNVILRPYTCFTLGFKITFIYNIENIETVDDYALNLIFQFKKQNIISSYNWFIEYDSKNNEKGKLILGAKPFEYNPKKYLEENERVVNAARRQDNKIYWDFEANEIYLNNGTEKIMINDYLLCSLEPSLGVIIGSNAYKLIVNELLEPFYDKQKCFKSFIYLLDNTYIMFYCNKDMKNFFKKSHINKINFLHRFFGKTFELNYEDLFEEKGNYIFLKVFFNRNEINYWRLGKPFLRKYFFSFNLDGRTISFYDFENNEGKKNNNKKSNAILIIVIIVLILICGILGFFLAKYLYIKKQKKKGEELTDNDDYNYDYLNQNIINQ